MEMTCGYSSYDDEKIYKVLSPTISSFSWPCNIIQKQLPFAFFPDTCRYRYARSKGAFTTGDFGPFVSFPFPLLLPSFCLPSAFLLPFPISPAACAVCMRW
jgi:hypothetical protein